MSLSGDIPMAELGDPQMFRNILENLQTGVYLIDRDQKIVFWNAGAEHITGYLRQDVVGRLSRASILAPSQEETATTSEAESALSSVLRDGKSVDVDVALRHKDGHRLPVRLRAAPIRNERGAVIGAVENFDESPSVSNWDRRQTRLATYGCLDETTESLSHDFTRTRLRENLATFTEHHVPCAVLCIQVDGMEHLRAAYGPAMIPETLHAAAQTLENSLRPTDSLGRWNERQFLAVLSECAESDIQAVAERLKKMVNSSAIQWWGDTVSITASMGGTAAQPGDTIESIVARAERALEASIAANGNRVTVFNP
jgi:PAS domain S-box-containing protein/diguanylate cyclase (GGDEF)-like protein